MADLKDSLVPLRDYFDSGVTLSYDFRKTQLDLLEKAILRYEKPLSEALFSDLKKSPVEVWFSETGLLLAEIRAARKNLRRWMRPKKVSSPLVAFGSTSKIYPSPLGVVLIIAPWNYPLQLLLNPLVGAIAAGNVAVLKPSELAPATEAVISRMIAEIFPENYVKLVSGIGSEVVPQMIREFRFDHIFFTGGTATGKAIYQLAASQLIPVTLELGGKSPCIIYEDADLQMAARRVVSTKFLNAGQSCIAPDYVLVKGSIKEDFLKVLKDTIAQFYSGNPAENGDYGKIIDKRHFQRLTGLLEKGSVYCGGQVDESSLFIAPTVLSDVSLDDPVMQQEIFGPLLAVRSFSTSEEAMKIVSARSHPLALYLFTQNKETQRQWIERISFGGGCINDTGIHFMNQNLPFGGVGASGIGAYHGKRSFQVFSHEKSVLKSTTLLDPRLRYPPWKGKLKWFKRLVR